jgi:hypothetical protein
MMTDTLLLNIDSYDVMITSSENLQKSVTGETPIDLHTSVYLFVDSILVDKKSIPVAFEEIGCIQHKGKYIVKLSKVKNEFIQSEEPRYFAS